MVYYLFIHMLDTSRSRARPVLLHISSSSSSSWRQQGPKGSQGPHMTRRSCEGHVVVNDTHTHPPAVRINNLARRRRKINEATAATLAFLPPKLDVSSVKGCRRRRQPFDDLWRHTQKKETVRQNDDSLTWFRVQRDAAVVHHRAAQDDWDIDVGELGHMAPLFRPEINETVDDD